MMVIVPSRGRPANARRLVEAWGETRCGAGLMIRVDDDDPELGGYLAMREQIYDMDFCAVEVLVGPRLRLGGTLNDLAPVAAKHFGVVGFMGDDHVPRTRDWDAHVLQAFADGARVVYGNDLIMGEQLPTAVFVDAAIVATLGYMVPPGLVHLFMDNYWRWLGEHLGALAYLPDVVIEHVHPVAGKAEWDDRYEEVNASAVWTADEATWHRWLADDSAAALAKLAVA